MTRSTAGSDLPQLQACRYARQPNNLPAMESRAGTALDQAASSSVIHNHMELHRGLRQCLDSGGKFDVEQRPQVAQPFDLLAHFFDLGCYLLQLQSLVCQSNATEIREESNMKRTALLVLALLLPSHAALAETLAGNKALALAALVAEHSPHIGAEDKRIMMRMLDGNLKFSFPPNKKISVLADRISCRAGDVDISQHSCELQFGNATRVLNGRRAHEIFAALVEAGVPPDGAAGRIFAVISHLSCAIDANKVKEKDGGGADCSFQLT